MALPYDALLTVDNVSRELQEAITGYDATEANTRLVTENIIQEVTRIMEGLLDRNLIVKKHERYFQYEDWDYDKGRNKYFVRSSDYPVVEIDTAGFTVGRSKHAREDDLILYTSRFSGLVTFYSGYKRSEQVIGDLTAEADLTDLGTLPGNLPYDIRNVALSGVLHALSERNQGPGQRSRTINPAIQSMTITEPLRDYLMRIINERIPHHKILV